MSGPLNWWQLLGVILASAFFWMQYVDLKDQRHSEPRRHLLIAFLLGIVAWGLAVLCLMALDTLGVPDIKFGEGPWTCVYCFLITQEPGTARVNAR